MFMTRYLFLVISENKNTVYLIPTIWTMIMQWKCYKVYERYMKFDTTQKEQKDKNLVFQKNR